MFQLLDHIIRVMSTPKLPSGHTWLEQYMQSMNYPLNNSGQCQGATYTWIHAELIGESDCFDQRLYLINGIPLSDFAHRLQNAKLAQSQLIAQIKIDVLKKMEDLLGKRLDVNQLRPNQKKQLHKMINKLIAQKSDADVIKLLEIELFFEAIALGQKGFEYPEFLDQHITDLSKTGSMVLPLVMSKKLEDLGGLATIDQFSGIYTLKELTTYFHLLQETIDEDPSFNCPFAIALTDSWHTVGFSYDKNKSTWKSFNINESPTRFIQGNNTMASTIFDDFQTQDATVFSSVIHTTGQHEEQVRKIITSWRKKISDLHKVTAHRVKSVDSNNASWLYIAAMAGNLSEVKTLLKHSDIDPNQAVNETGATPLLIAAQNGHDKVVAELLKHKKTNPNMSKHDGTPPLFMAAQQGHKKVIAKLLAHPDINPNQRINNGCTPLLIASQNAHTKIVAKLLAHPDIDPNQASPEGVTPLFIAAQNGYAKIVAKLLAHANIDPNIPRKNGETPLHTAILNGRKDVVEQLLAHPKVNPNQAGAKGETPLLLAIRKGQVEIVSKLLAHKKIDPNQAMDNNKTPLFCAILNDRSDIVSKLLAHPDITANLAKTNGLTPLHAATQTGRLDIVDQLINHDKTNLNSTFIANVSVLQAHAETKNRKELLDALLQSKTEKTLPLTLSGFTALHLAVFFGHTEIVNVLLTAEAALLDTELGISVLALAEVMGNDNIVKLIKNKMNNSEVGDYKNDTNLLFFSAQRNSTLIPLAEDLRLEKAF